MEGPTERVRYDEQRSPKSRDPGIQPHDFLVPSPQSMKRYTGQPLPTAARVALVVNDLLGNLAIATPLAQALLHWHEGCRLDYFGGERTRELEKASPLFEWRTSVTGIPHDEATNRARDRHEMVDGYDLVINLEAGELHRRIAGVLAPQAFVTGPVIAAEGELAFQEDLRGQMWRDQSWLAASVTARYPFLSTGFIAEIFVRLAYLQPVPDAPWPGGLPRYAIPRTPCSTAVPPVMIAMGSSLSTKLWPISKWRRVLQLLAADGFTVALLGAPPERGSQRGYCGVDSESDLVEEGLCLDLRGQLTLPEVADVVARAELVLTLDNGILHLAAATDTPTVGLYRREYHRLWAPPNPNLVVLVPERGDVENIPVATVMDAVRTKLSQSEESGA